MRIALRAQTPPFLQSVSRTAGTPGHSESSLIAGAGDAPATSKALMARQVGGDEAMTGADRGGHAWRVDVPGVADAVPVLRKWIRLLLAKEAKLAEAFELIVSEYGTNALWHSASGTPGGRIRVELCIGSCQAWLTVLDDGLAPTRIDQETDAAEHGRGLILADAYADKTGQYDSADGHVAWALINH